MTSARVFSAGLSLACATACAVAHPVPVVPSDESCAVYQAAIAFASGGTTSPIVIYDSTSLATPSFAFHAWVGMGARHADTGFVISDSLLKVVLEENKQPRPPLPTCIAGARKVTRLWYDSIKVKFSDREKGWEIFRGAYPGASGFLVASRISWLSADKSQALIYVAHALDWLAGEGRLLYLRKSKGHWKVQSARALWMS